MCKKWLSLLLCLLLCLCLLPAALAEDEEYDAPWYRYPLEGTTAVVPEGITWMGGSEDYVGDEGVKPRWIGADPDAPSPLVVVDGYDLYPAWYDPATAGPAIDIWDYDPAYVIEREEDFPCQSVRLPSTLRGLGLEAIFNFSMEELVLPEGFEVIGEDALASCEIGRLVIPASCVRIYDSEYCGVGAYEVAAGNPVYSSRDGVLFSADGKTLLRYPSARTDTHYDVPRGVEAIADGAFCQNEYLQSVSLPIGLKRIGRRGFCQCGRLMAVNVPLTVTELGERAFADCVSLQRATLPPALQRPEKLAEDLVFDNCPRLGGAFQGDNADTLAGTDPDSYILEEAYNSFAVAAPAEDGGSIPVYAAADSTAPIVGQIPGGSVIALQFPAYTWADYVAGRTPAFYAQGTEEPEHGYVAAGDVQPLPGEDRLFSLFVDTPAEALPLYASPRTGSEPVRIPADAVRVQTWATENLPWGEADWYDGDTWHTAWFPLQAAALSCAEDGSDAIYGVVMPAEVSLRVPLLTQPDAAADVPASFYTGTQLEVTGSVDNYYAVALRGLTGYLCKDDVRIVLPKGAENE